MANTLQNLPVREYLGRLSVRSGWTVAMAAAIAMGGLVNSTIINVLVLTPSGKIAAGAIEGALIAAALWIVLRNFDIEVDFRTWMLTIIAADVVRLLIPLGGYPRATPAIWSGRECSMAS